VSAGAAFPLAVVAADVAVALPDAQPVNITVASNTDESFLFIYFLPFCDFSQYHYENFPNSQ
jgi:hypothetical protein